MQIHVNTRIESKHPQIREQTPPYPPTGDSSRLYQLPVHANPSFCSRAGPTLYVARSFNTQAMVQSTATPHAQLGRRNRSSRSTPRDHSLSAPVNLQLQRCEHDETDRVAPSGALLWTRGWHPMPIMLHGARKADSPPKFKKASPSLTFAQRLNGTPHATAPRGGQAGASIKTRRQKHEM